MFTVSPRRRFAVLLVALGLLVTAVGCSESRKTAEPQGPWTRLGTGTHDKVSWSLYAAEASHGGVCLSLDLDPQPFKTSPPTDDPHEGRQANCVFATDGDHPAKAVWAAELPGMTYHFLAGVGRDSTASYSGATSEGTLPNLLGDGSESTAEGMAVFLFIYSAGDSLDAVSVEDRSGATSLCATDWTSVAVLGGCETQG